MSSGRPFTIYRSSILLIGLLIVLQVAVAATADMYIFAVSSEGKGIPARLIVEVTPGHGNISLTLNSIVGEDTQRSINNAIHAAVEEAEANFYQYDYKVTINSGAEYVSGPSAGLPIALATYAALKGMDVPDYISATGTIDEDGSVGPVGGIYEKAKAAAEVGVKVFLIPKGERYVEVPQEEEIEPGIVVPSTGKVDIVALAKKEWNMDVYEVSTLRQAIQIAFEGETPEVNAPTEEETPPEVNFIPPAVGVVYSEDFKSLVDEFIDMLANELEKNCANEPPYYNEIRASAKSYLKRAKLVESKGYYYTAGNYAFLGLVNMSTLNEVCEHPSIVDPNSLAFQDYLETLREKLNSAITRAEKFDLTTSNYEWVGGARERLIRAEATLNGLPASSSIALIRQLKSAEYWIYTAQRMLDIAEEKNDGVPLTNVEDAAKNEIMLVEDLIYSSQKEPGSAGERLYWAKEAYNRGWYYAAFAEAALAKGIFIGEYTRGDSLKEQVERYLQETEHYRGMWAELYRTHGLYYYEAAKAYEEEGLDAKANDMLRTALQMLIASEDFSRFAEGVPSVTTRTTVQKVVPNEKKAMAAAVGTFFLVLAILLILYAFKFSRKSIHRYLHRLPPEKKKEAEELLEKIYALSEAKRNLEKVYKKRKDEEVKKEIEKMERKIKKLEEKLAKLLESAPQQQSSRPSQGKPQSTGRPPSRRRRGARRR